jgi:hypothetical protein
MNKLIIIIVFLCTLNIVNAQLKFRIFEDLPDVRKELSNSGVIWDTFNNNNGNLMIGISYTNITEFLEFDIETGMCIAQGFETTSSQYDTSTLELILYFCDKYTCRTRRNNADTQWQIDISEEGFLDVLRVVKDAKISWRIELKLYKK